MVLKKIILNGTEIELPSGGASTDYVDDAIANAITNTLNTPV